MITYRKFVSKDVITVQALALKAWLFAYKSIYTKKNVIKMVLNYYSKNNLQETLIQIKKGKEQFIVAIEKTKLRGYAHIGKKNKTWELFRIYVDPKILGKGIGSGLLILIEQFLKSKGATKYCAHPHAKNPIAIQFYVKKGFK
ncbi:MAG: GNAT family N-acetyltransferase [Candidatus Woesearchaeota archaeon]|nr:GNAT family N-acetyltransferase [Candidatus Woesearchaeota archaeon]